AGWLPKLPAPDRNSRDGFSVVKVELQPSFLRSAIYQQFGAYPDPKGVVEDRTGTLDRLADEVGSSMIQQRERLLDLCEEMLQQIVDDSCPPNAHAEDWDLDALRVATKERFNFEPSIDESKLMERETLVEALWADVEKVIEAREAELSLPGLLFYARRFYLSEIDERWIDHLKSMEALREGIGLRGYGQKDPKQEYKKEGFVIFGEMMGSIGRNVCEKLFHMQVQRDESATQQPAAQQQRKPRRVIESGGGAEPRAASGNGGQPQDEGKTVRRDQPKVGRNDPCPCGSGKKYKKCHGAVATVCRSALQPRASRPSPVVRRGRPTTAARSRSRSFCRAPRRWRCFPRSAWRASERPRCCSARTRRRSAGSRSPRTAPSAPSSPRRCRPRRCARSTPSRASMPRVTGSSSASWCRRRTATTPTCG